MSLEMAHKVILPPKKNYIPQFLKQRDINSYYIPLKKKNIFNISLREKMICFKNDYINDLFIIAQPSWSTFI